MNPNTAKALLNQMKRIRFVEAEIARRYPEGKMRCPTHLSVGQEGVAAAAGLALRQDDKAVSGHRAHAHYLGKGGNLKAMLAEIYGKATGCCQGKGGSMHLIDESVGFMGSTAIVGGTVPVGVGLAYGMKLKGSSQVSCIFHGDAVLETGAFFESANFAALKQLPVLFLCENNLYSVYSPLQVRQAPGRDIASLVAGLGITVDRGDGNDAVSAYEKISKALAEIRAGGGPRFLEFSTYRWLEHCGPNFDNDIGYRTEAEYLAWKAKDPVERLQAALLADATMNADDVARMDADIKQEVDAAFADAEAAPWPAPETAYTDLYANPWAGAA
ncbi:MAG: thiamine pyrophosphate-dependent dehydrogenase E1 component subunit alpha [Rhodocyclaceae bacterium]|nr:MAG: thiamine pyrophosphate-dependent dehydrogenase E1 component subunit alpha [Rhodocyclaceae bacterium]